MKNLILLFFPFMIILSLNAQEPDSVFTDTSRYRTGIIEGIIDYAFFDGKIYQHGNFKNYNVNGTIRSEGVYKYFEKALECYECYRVIEDTIFKKYEDSRVNEAMVGEWKFYDEDGNLYKKGFYSTKVHQYSSSTYAGPNKPTPVGVGFIYLEHGKWIFYDKTGKEISYHWFNNGQLVKVENL